MNNFLHGEVKLWKTYWLIVFPVGILFTIGSKILEELLNNGGISLNIYLIFTVINAVIIGIFAKAIWSSSAKYEGSKVWKILVRIVAVIQVITVILGLISVIMIAMDPSIIND